MWRKSLAERLAAEVVADVDIRGGVAGRLAAGVFASLIFSHT